MKALIKFLFTLFLITQVSAQKEANHWYFGEQIGIDFDTGEAVFTDKNPILSTTSTLNPHSVSISSKSGEFLFMSNGVTVWNKNFEMMENGDAINIDNLNKQITIFAFPKPNTPNVYCILTEDLELNYAEIDMSLNGGLGKVILKNKILENKRHLNQIVVVKHSNGEDVWIVGRESNTKNLVSYLLTKNGLKERPVVNPIAFGMKFPGSIFISPDTKFILENGQNATKLNPETLEQISTLFTILYNFNRTTGEISFEQKIGDITKEGLAGRHPSFSPNSKYLYTTGREYLLRYNLESKDINNSEEIIYYNMDSIHVGEFGYPKKRKGLNFNHLRIGPNGKMYAFDEKSEGKSGDAYGNIVYHYIGKKYPKTYSSSIIELPEHTTAASVNFESEAFPLKHVENFSRPTREFPTFIPSQLNNIIFYKNPCFEQETHFHLDDNITYARWDFGDPSSGNNNTVLGNKASHIFSNIGTYTVTATVISNRKTQFLKTQVTIVELPEIITHETELVQCDDDIDGFSFFNLNEVLPKITEVPEDKCITFHKSLEDAENNDNPIQNTTTYKNKIRSNDVVWARIANKHTCFRTVKVNLTVITTQIPSSFQKIILNNCEEENGDITFNFSEAQETIRDIFPKEQLLSFSYYTNLSDALAEQNKIPDPTNYTTKINETQQDIFVRIDSENENDCVGLGNYISLKSKGKSPKFELDEMDYFCPNSPNLEISTYNPAGEYSYTWMDENGTVLGNDASLTVTQPGNYYVSANSGIDCDSKWKQIEIIELHEAAISIGMIRIAGNSFNEYTVSIDITSLKAETYEYSIDNEFDNFQDIPIFEGITSGYHYIYIRDKEKCATTKMQFYIIGVPKFFSPNDDGINDTWNVGSLDPLKFHDITVKIFDRTGLLITTIHPDEEGWDGYFQGKKMIVTDYWFTIIYKNNRNKIIKQEGNFSLLK